jgi:diguanylate cyclase (GGDEF)-like protein
MERARSRFAVLLDYAFVEFQKPFRLGINAYCAEAGVDAFFFGMGNLDDADPEDRAKMAFFDMINRREFDGIIAMTMTFSNRGRLDVLRSRLKALGPIPLVSIGPSLMGEDSVCVDNAHGMRQIMRHLVEEHRYRRFAFVSGPYASEDSRLRLRVFNEELDAAGIRPDERMIFEGNFLPPSGEAAVRAFFENGGDRPEVIVCANDLMAIGAWNEVRKRGLNVPYDVAITGYDDMRLSNALSHQFTTIYQPFENLGYLAARRLHALARGEPLAPLTPIDSELRVRNSCGCVDLGQRRTLGEKAARSETARTMKALLDECIADGRIRHEEPALLRDWSNGIWRALEGSGSSYDLEELLHDSMGGLDADGRGMERKETLLKLYSLLLEESTQNAFLDHWSESSFSSYLRILVDQLHVAVLKTRSLQAHEDMLRRIADFSGVPGIVIVRFADFADASLGGSVLYGRESIEETEGGPWIPAPGSWFPRGAGSWVVNMISSGDDRYAYLLVDARATHYSVYEYLRIQFSTIGRDLFNLADIHRLNAELRNEISVRENAERKLREALSMVEQLSIEDELTGLRNRRGFFALAEQQIKFLNRQGCGYIVLYADLDGLKTINDKWGHRDGDLAIRSAGEILQRALRESDIVARLGGDEFTALVNHANPPNYSTIKERIEEGCARKSGELGRPWRLSMSIGHYHVTKGCELSLAEMLERADAELYREKQARKANRPTT